MSFFKYCRFDQLKFWYDNPILHVKKKVYSYEKKFHEKMIYMPSNIASLINLNFGPTGHVNNDLSTSGHRIIIR